MDTLQEMRTFLAVADAGSFTRAAERLGQSKAVASKQVIRLEERLGVRLLNRTTRALSLTEVGQAYYQRAERIIEDLDELEQVVQDRHAAPKGQIVVSAPTTFGEMHLTGAIGRFLKQHPGITIDLRLTDRFVSLADEGVDLAVRISNLQDSSMVARKLSSTRIMPCAAPAYLEEFGVPDEPGDLVDHACIVDSNFKARDEWLFQKGEERVAVRVPSRFQVNSARAARTMALDGAGIGLIPSYAIADDIRNGRLVPLLQSFETGTLGVYALYLPNRLLAGKVRSFIDFLVDAFSGDAVWQKEGARNRQP